MRNRVVLLGFLVASLALSGARCRPAFLEPGSPLFLSPQSNPLALSADGQRLYVANTTSGTLSVLDVSDPTSPVELREIPVGMDPVSVAVRPGSEPPEPGEDELVFVANHISDSISVVSRQRLDVVGTIQELDADGVSTTNEPVGIAFAGRDRVFVALDHPNQVLVVDLDASGTRPQSLSRLPITAQAPRALAVAGERLFVAAFESGNQTEFPSCAPGDPRGLDLEDPYDMGCQFQFDLLGVAQLLQLNAGAPVIRDRDLPDRDLFVFDTQSLAPVQVIDGVGTLLYGVAAGEDGARVYVTNTDARNHRNGLAELDNRMFENRLSVVSCQGPCDQYDAPLPLDLDALAGGSVPTPYGVAIADDGQLVAITASGSDGSSGLAMGDLPGLVLLDASHQVVGALSLGAIPQGLALRSGPDGAARWAFVLNTVDSSLSVVDLADPARPESVATLVVGSDPTPPALRRGRMLFSAARASTSGSFSCESCHPNGGTDQLLWTINAVSHPMDGPDERGAIAEARTTMMIRGLRDTLPLHWDGSLGDPLPGVRFPWDSAPDCDLADGETSCFRHLVDASLAGVMCDPLPDCAAGPSGAPGAFDDRERRDIAQFLSSVSHPPGPARRPGDDLSSEGLQGARDFFTTDNGLGGSPDLTCGEPGSGCHQLPLLTGTNHSSGVEAPSFRGLWDRFLLFSSGFPTSEEVLTLVQDCANGIGPLNPCGEISQSDPSFDEIWDPAAGMSERGSLMAAVNSADRVSSGLEGPGLWAFVTEMSTGLAGLAGRQLSLDPVSAGLPETVARLEQLERAAVERRIVARAWNEELGELGFAPATGLWTDATGRSTTSRSELLGLAAAGRVITVTALPGGGVTPRARQPLITPEVPGTPEGPANLPRPTAGASHTIRLSVRNVSAEAMILIDGRVCGDCTLNLSGDPGGGEIGEVEIPSVPGAGPHMLQLAEPHGLSSNELLFVAE